MACQVATHAVNGQDRNLARRPEGCAIVRQRRDGACTDSGTGATVGPIPEQGKGMTATKLDITQTQDAEGRLVLTYPEATSITREELIARARAMIPRLRDRA